MPLLQTCMMRRLPLSHAVFEEINGFDLGENRGAYIVRKVESFNYFVQFAEFVVVLDIHSCFIPHAVGLIFKPIFKDGEESGHSSLCLYLIHWINLQ